MDESQSNYAERKKPNKKRIHTVWFCLHKTLEKAKGPAVTESRSMVIWSWQRLRESLQRDTETLRAMEVSTPLIMVASICVSKLIKLYTLNTCILFYANYTLIKLKKAYIGNEASLSPFKTVHSGCIAVTPVKVMRDVSQLEDLTLVGGSSGWIPRAHLA